MKNKHKHFFDRLKLIFSFSVIALIIISSFLMSMLIFFRFVDYVDFLDIDRLPAHIERAVFLVVSVILGLIFSFIFRKIVLLPLHDCSDALDKIANGDYSTEIKPHGIKSISRVAEYINKTAKELRSIEIMRKDFIDNFSHEFRTPIVSIEGFAKILKDDNLEDAEKEEYLNIIISEAHRLSELSTNILTLNRLENQSVLTDKKTFNVSEQIRLCVVLLESKWNQKEINFDFSGDEYKFNGNEHLLQQLWLNIIDNAVKYSSHGGEIFISVTKKASHLIFNFSDKGKGMTEEQLKHAFDRFYQGDISHKTSGNGIGLTVAKKICELHGGKIAITSEPDNGTTVEVTLPL